jgi:hypothetical protein
MDRIVQWIFFIIFLIAGAFDSILSLLLNNRGMNKMHRVRGKSSYYDSGSVGKF